MTPDERDAGLTAYALDDPGLTPVERAEIEQRLAADPAARRAVEEAREVAKLLAAGFAGELAAAKPPGVTVPSEVAAKPKAKRRWVNTLAIAAGVLLPMVLGVGLLLPSAQKVREVGARSTGARPTVEAETGAESPKKPTDAPPADPVLNKVLQRASNPLMPFQENGPAAAASPGLPGLLHADPKPASEPVAAGGEVALGFQPPTLAPMVRGSTPYNPTRDFKLRGQGQTPAAGPPQFGNAFGPNAGQGFGGGQMGGGQPRGGDGSGINGFGGGGFGGFGGQPAGFGGGGFGGIAAPGPGQPSDETFLPGLRLKSELRAPGQDRFPATVENAFTPVEGQNALSTFGVDVDTASYSIIRNYLSRGQLPPPDAVRLEEVVNYFPYQDKPPTGDDPFAVTVEVADCPWQPGHRLARIGLKAKPIAADKRPPSNLVFLIDISGSMNEPNKLPLVKASLKLLVGQLGENDRVAMVVYAGNSGLVLDSTSAVNKGLILEALDRLEAGGSTNGAGGLQQAYDVAVSNFVKNGTNRVVLCTDGDWNVGTTGTDALVNLIEEKRKTGVFLSVFGFGMGNLRDEMMVKLAGKGNGNYGYIDTIREAHKALVEQLGGTLVAVAKDVKIQVEFNPAAVKAYRLLGYEKRALAAKDFADDTKDAGEMGAGHVVTALYELVPAGDATPTAGEGLRYQPNPDPKPAAAPTAPAKEAFLVKMRHKKPDGDVSVLRELPVANTTMPAREASEDFRFSAAAAAFALVLRESPYKGSATLAAALELAEGATRFDPSGYRAEFVELVRKAQGLPGRR